MHDDPRGDIVWRAQTPSGWLHDLRNDMNTAGVSVVLGRRLLARGDNSGALDMLARAEESLAQCRALLAAGDEVLGLATPQSEPHEADTPPTTSHL
jgi:hypothetical protein